MPRARPGSRARQQRPRLSSPGARRVALRQAQTPERRLQNLKRVRLGVIWELPQFVQTQPQRDGGAEPSVWIRVRLEREQPA